jgi:hypothetical protein
VAAAIGGGGGGANSLHGARVSAYSNSGRGGSLELATITDEGVVGVWFKHRRIYRQRSADCGGFLSPENEIVWGRRVKARAVPVLVLASSD